MSDEKCIWGWSDNGASYATLCGNGADHYNEIDSFKYCPYCGRELEHVHE